MKNLESVIDQLRIARCDNLISEDLYKTVCDLLRTSVKLRSWCYSFEAAEEWDKILERAKDE